MTIINESGLYSLILTSRKPAANRLDADEKNTIVNSDSQAGTG